MSTVAFEGKEYEMDVYGFLDPPEQWDHGFAEGMAAMVGIYNGLSERHWQLIHYLRKKFLEEETVPVLVLACADNGMRLTELRSLFPTGYHRGACKIAGINYQFMWDTNHWLTYETAPPLRPRYELDPLGHLADLDQWDEDFVRLALTQGDPQATPTDRHFQVIRYLRDSYVVNRALPTIFETCSVNDLSLEELRELFPAGYRRGACLASGLPFFG